MAMKLGLKTTIASMDVDSQCGFSPLCPDELPVQNAERIVEELNQQAKLARFRLGCKDAHPANAVWVATAEHPPLSPIMGDHVDVRWPKHCVPGTKGFELLPGLPHPVNYDYFVWKGVEPDLHPYGACYHDLKDKLSTGIIEFCQAKGVTTLIVGGLTTEYCVKNTVLQLLIAGFTTILNLGACQGLDPSHVDEAIAIMKAHGAIIIQSSAELLHLLTRNEIQHG